MRIERIWVIQNSEGRFYKGRRRVPIELRERYGDLCDWAVGLNAAALYWNHKCAIDDLMNLPLKCEAYITEYEFVEKRKLSCEVAKLEIK